MASKYQHIIKNDIIRVVDGGGDQKVSENAEAVCAQLLRTYGDKMRIMFLDGVGWHQMHHKDGKLTKVEDLETKNEIWAATKVKGGPRVTEVKEKKAAKKSAAKKTTAKKATAKKEPAKKSGADATTKTEAPKQPEATQPRPVAGADAATAAVS